MEKRTAFSIWYYLIIITVIFGLELIFFSAPKVKEISYKEFRDKLAADKIKSLIIKENSMYGQLKPAETEKEGKAEGVDTKDKPKSSLKFFNTPWRLKLKEFEKEREKELMLEFKVTRLEDPKLLEDLQSHGVNYRGEFGSSWLQNFLLNWIIPFGILVLLWGFIFRRMGGGAGVLNVGKSKAKIYAEDLKKRITFNDVAGIDEAVEEVKIEPAINRNGWF